MPGMFGGYDETFRRLCRDCMGTMPGEDEGSAGTLRGYVENVQAMMKLYNILFYSKLLTRVSECAGTLSR